MEDDLRSIIKKLQYKKILIGVSGGVDSIVLCHLAYRLNINFDYYDNRNKIHQKKDGQCGMYCLYIIIKLLREDKEPLFFKNFRVTDEEMRDYREIYFNNI